MNTKRTIPVSFFLACLTVLVAFSLFAASAAASTGNKTNDVLTISGPKTNASDIAADKEGFMTIIHESAEIRFYDDGSPYLHDVLTNYTDQTITETEYCLLAYNADGQPLKLKWDFMDSSSAPAYSHLVRTGWLNILPGQTEDYQGGWSLEDAAAKIPELYQTQFGNKPACSQNRMFSHAPSGILRKPGLPF